MPKPKKTNPQLIQLIQDLKKASHKNKAPLWQAVGLRLEKALSQRAEVNVSKLARVLRENEIALVPGKVLGAGELKKPIKVAAFSFSKSAKEKIAKAKGKSLSIPELLKECPKGTGVRIIG